MPGSFAPLSAYQNFPAFASCPTQVVEAACLAAVPPPDITYELAIWQRWKPARGHLSALQLESITYACQAHQTFLYDGSRRGFFIGDGAGMGKGRQIAGLLIENLLHGRTKVGRCRSQLPACRPTRSPNTPARKLVLCCTSELGTAVAAATVAVAV